jgi:hypothetical protein
MPRKPLATATADSVQVVANTLPEDAAHQALVHQATAGYAAERDFINQLLGQIQMADAMTQFSRTVRTSKLAFIKESKAYRGLAGRKTPDGPEFSGTWEEFCVLLGRSVDQVDEDIRNYRVFAEDAYEAMTQAGIGYRELRQLRKLPEDEREALIEVAKSGNKDALVEIAESLITKHADEKKKLSASAERAAKKADGLADQVARQQETIDELKAERKRLRHQWAHKPPEERVEELRNAVSTQVLAVLAAISPGDDEPGGLHGAILALVTDESSSDDHTEFLAGVFAELIVTLRKLRDNLPVTVPVRESAAKAR